MAQSRRFAVFLSYRRSDAIGHAGRLADALARQFGPQHVFVDVDSIEIGDDFTVAIHDALQSSSVMVAVVGPGWLASDATGTRRIDAPADYVRREVEMALELGVRIVPVLVHGAASPGEDELPTSIRELARLQAFELSDRSWNQEIRSLLDRVERWVAAPTQDSYALPPVPPNDVLQDAFAVACRSPIVGRADPVNDLVAKVFDRAGPRLVALVGEPGIGKSRVAAEVAALVHQRGATVLRGACSDDAVRPYEPFTEAITWYLDSLQATERLCVEPWTVRLAALLPNRHVSEPVERSWRHEGQRTETDRVDLLDAAAEFFAALSAERPCTLVIDDLHWATASTTLLLRHILEWNADVPLTILATVREVELQANAQLLEVLRSSRHRDRVTSIVLDGLDLAGVAELAPGMTHADVRALTTRTAGNPLFIVQLLEHLGREGGAINSMPPAVGEVITERLRGFPATTVEALEVASAVGTRFSLPVVEAVLGDDRADDIHAAIAGKLVAEAEPSRLEYEFIHALVRDALYHRLGAARRARMHHRIAEAIEHLGFDDVDSLAYHWTAASVYADIPKLVDTATRAAEQALARLVPEDALEILDRALLVVEQRGEQFLRERIELRLARAEPLYELTREDEEIETANVAVAEARRLEDPIVFARAAIVRCYGLRVGDVDLGGRELLEEALAALPDDAVALRARTFGQLAGVLLFNYGDRTGAEQARVRALALARAAGDAYTLTEVLTISLGTMVGSPNLEQQRTLAEQLRSIASDAAASPTQANRGDAGRTRTTREPITGPTLYADVVLLRTQLGLADISYRHTLERMRIARESGGTLGRLVLSRIEGGVALMTGDFEGAENAINFILNNCGDLADYEAMALAALFLLRREQGRTAEVSPFAEALLELRPGLRAFETALALASLDESDTGSAAQRFDALTRDGIGLPRDNTWSTGLYVLAEVAATLGEVRDAPALWDALAPFGGQLVLVGEGAAVLGAADRALGQLAMLQRKHEEALSLFENAISLEARVGALPLRARSRYWHARAVLASPTTADHDVALLIERVIADASDLGMPLLRAKAEALRDLP